MSGSRPHLLPPVPDVPSRARPQGRARTTSVSPATASREISSSTCGRPITST